MEQLANHLRGHIDNESGKGKKENTERCNPDKRVRFQDEISPMNPKYKNLFARIDTFEKRSWPSGHVQSPHRLAEGGFYYTGKLTNKSILI